MLSGLNTVSFSCIFCGTPFLTYTPFVDAILKAHESPHMDITCPFTTRISMNLLPSREHRELYGRVYLQDYPLGGVKQCGS